MLEELGLCGIWSGSMSWAHVTCGTPRVGAEIERWLNLGHATSPQSVKASRLSHERGMQPSKAVFYPKITFVFL